MVLHMLSCFVSSFNSIRLASLILPRLLVIKVCTNVRHWPWTEKTWHTCNRNTANKKKKKFREEIWCKLCLENWVRLTPMLSSQSEYIVPCSWNVQRCNLQGLISDTELGVLLLPGWKMKSFYWRLDGVLFFISTHSIPPDNSSLGERWSASHVSNVPLHVMCNYFFFPDQRGCQPSTPTVPLLKKISLVTDTDFLIRKKGWRRTKHEINIVHYQLLWTIVTCEFWTGCSDIEIDLLTSESRFLIPVNSFANLPLLQLTS